VKETYIDVPGGRVWAAAHGESGTPLLCLHGGPGLPHDYIDSLVDLSDGHRVVFYDQLGCGRSERPSDPHLWTLERFLEELAAVRRALDLGPLHLLGQSWGGLLALEHAMVSRDILSLTLASPVVSVPRWAADCRALVEALPDATRACIDRHEAAGHTGCLEYQGAVLEFWKRHVCRLEVWPDALERALAGFGAEVYETMWGPSEFSATGNLASHDPTSRLQTIAVRTLITCGRYDEASPEANREYESLIPNARMVVFDNSSHTAHLEERGRYMDVLRAFLADAEA
jgi:proline iminopeptidase